MLYTFLVGLLNSSRPKGDVPVTVVTHRGSKARMCHLTSFRDGHYQCRNGIEHLERGVLGFHRFETKTPLY